MKAPRQALAASLLLACRDIFARSPKAQLDKPRHPIHPGRDGQLERELDARTRRRRGVGTRPRRSPLRTLPVEGSLVVGWQPPNGSRLSCGRNVCWRKEARMLIELDREATQL